MLSPMLHYLHVTACSKVAGVCVLMRAALLACPSPDVSMTPRPCTPAGIEVRERYKNKRSIDYGSEVVFEKKPAPGFYDTGAEGAATKAISQEFRPVTLEELEGKRRKVGGHSWLGQQE